MTIEESPKVRVRVLLFARYAEVVGTEACDMALPVGATVSDALAELRVLHPSASMLPDRPLCARNQSQVSLGHQLSEGDELALLPPLAGG